MLYSSECWRIKGWLIFLILERAGCFSDSYNLKGLDLQRSSLIPQFLKEPKVSNCQSLEGSKVFLVLEGSKAFHVQILTEPNACLFIFWSWKGEAYVYSKFWQDRGRFIFHLFRRPGHGFSWVSFAASWQVNVFPILGGSKTFDFQITRGSKAFPLDWLVPIRSACSN